MEEQIKQKNHSDIRKASDKKILRRQMELLAEYSRLPSGNKYIPKSSRVILEIYRELSKTKRVALLTASLLCVSFGLLYGLNVQFVKFFKGK